MTCFVRGLAAILLALILVPAAAAQQTTNEEVEGCLACHGEQDLAITFPSGETRSLFVDRAALGASVHAGDLVCTDCHAGLDEVPHPETSFKTLAAFRASFYEACKGCHFDNYTQALDGVHYGVLSKGDTRAPWCADCHGAHGIQPAAKPRSAISRTCAACHQDISDIYAKSAHGKALLSTENADVPVCSDCHRSHDIADPRKLDWRLKTPELCGKCHTNQTLMAKYGLSANVLQTYLADFHGTSASLTRPGQAGGTERLTALCTDCHGVHDIVPVKSPDSPVLQANLTKTCQRCHAGASEAFPAAWLSHYEPSWERTPLVYGVKVFYVVFIPLVIGGLVLQILLHLWRLVVNR